MFRATRLLRAVTKTSTGLVGLRVDVNGRKNLIEVQKKLLAAVQTIPEDAAYRKSVEATANHRLKVATETEDEKAIEDLIAFGQLEELIEQGNDELELIEFYAEHRGWEKVVDSDWKAQTEDDLSREPAPPEEEAKA